MLVEIITDEKGHPIGWSLQGKDKVEVSKLAIIRDLQFFGIDETAIIYAGREQGNDAEGDPGILSWKQRGPKTE
jgi:hypothetical protein